jgi:hypothetical protein
MKNLIFGLCLLLIPLSLSAEIVVIGNLNSPVNNLSKREVQDIFLGRTRALPNGNFVLPLDLVELRSNFYLLLTNRPIEQIDAYWARIMFSGQNTPPINLPDEQAMLKTIAENTGAIGYMDKRKINEKLVRVLLILE